MGLFMNSSHGIGPDFSQTGLNAPSIFPTTSLALRARVEVTEGVLFRVAALDGVPGDVDDPGGTHISWTKDEGLLLTAEFAHFTSQDGEPNGGKVALGAFSYTARTAHLDEAPALEATESSRNHGLYLLAEHPLYADGENAGLTGFLRVGVADAEVNQIGAYLGAGLVWTGRSPAGPSDRIGLAVAHARNGSHFVDFEASADSPHDRAETAIELTYSAGLSEWLTVQPDLQYIINPGTDLALENALVLSLRSVIAF